ncbi:MAG: efflux RND transporter permease subunit, partial [Pirellulaceae bacterium]
GREEKPESDLQLLVSNIGVLMDWPAAYTPNGGPMDAFMLVQTKSHESIFDVVTDLRKTLNEKYPHVDFAFDTGGMLTAALNMGEPSPIHFQIESSNLETGQEVGHMIREIAESITGTADSRVAQRIDYPVVNVKIDRQKAQELNVNVDEVMKNLVSATNSSINFEPAFWIDPYKGNHYFLGVQYPEELLQTRDVLLDIPVRGGEDGVVYLRDVLDEFEETTAPYVINHRNITRVTDVYVNILPGYDIGSVVTQIEAELVKLGAAPEADERGSLFRLGSVADEDKTDNKDPVVWTSQPLTNADKYKGRNIRMMGEVREMRDSFTQFSSGLIVAAILVYLVMVAQFRSFLDPMIILMAVPLGFVGVVAALMLTGTNLSIMAFMGIVMIVGIVVEYSIVLVDFANRELATGKTPREAILEATRVRLRPILMTSLTTWLAMLPMAIGFGTGSEANMPLARAIIGGVIGATVLSLFVVPCLYVMIKKPVADRPESAPALA